jgi:hypothetical protein
MTGSHSGRARVRCVRGRARRTQRTRVSHCSFYANPTPN